MRLLIHHPDAIAEPYDVSTPELFEYAIAHEADYVADEFAQHGTQPKVIEDARSSLRVVGDTYRDPVGILWELIEDDDA